MGLLQYTTKRILTILPVLFGVSVVSFLVIHMVPGDPISATIGASSDVSDKTLQEIRRQHGLHLPLYVQYLRWISGVFQGDFGTTIASGRSVSKIVFGSLVPTLWVSVAATLVSVVIGIPAGIVSAANQYTTKDKVMTLFAFLGLSVPNFLLGLLLILVFGLFLNLFPTLGFTSPLKQPIEGIRHLILPAIALGTALSAVIMRMMRSSLLEVMSEDYIKNARSNGLSRSLIINKHAVRNALLPTLTVIGLNFGTILGGTVVIEYVFGIKGLGWVVLDAISYRKYRVIQAVVLLTAFMFILVNLIVDLSYAFYNPKVKYD